MLKVMLAAVCSIFQDSTLQKMDSKQGQLRYRELWPLFGHLSDDIGHSFGLFWKNSSEQRSSIRTFYLEMEAFKILEVELLC